MIRLEQVSVTFNQNTPLEKTALRGIDLDIQAGDFMIVTGSNGAGKSTLLNLLAGRIPLSEGKITYDFKTRNKTAIAHVFQDPRIGTCEALTVEENLAFAARRGLSRPFFPSMNRASRKQFREALSEIHLGLENRLKDKVTTLSGGERQALSLVMATLRPCELLLLDEPTAALDPKTSQTILDLIQRLIQKNGLTALMITHQIPEIKRLGNRRIEIKGGQILNLNSTPSFRA